MLRDEAAINGEFPRKVLGVGDADDPLAGSWPMTNKGHATVAMIDFAERGSTLIINRVISPRRTRSSAQQKCS